MKQSLFRITVTSALALSSAVTLAQTQGVLDNEIVLGSIQDLSGPVAAFGKHVQQGMKMRVDEINDKGGIHGRKIRLIVEDNKYDPKNSVLAAQKLVNRDEVFAMIGNLGTATNMAALPLQLRRNVINFYPLTSAREMFDPFHRLKFAFSNTYHDQMRVIVPQLAKEKGAKEVCSMYQDDEYGQEVLQGAEEGLKETGMQMAEKTSFKRGATDFSSQMQRLASEKCELVVLGTLIRETIGGITTAKRLNFSPVFVVSAGAYSNVIHQLGGADMNGLYAAMTAQAPYLDAESTPVRDWSRKYNELFKQEPAMHSVYGYLAIDSFARAAEAAGKKLDTDSFVVAMEKLVIAPDRFGSPEMRFSSTNRLASTASRLSQIRNGRWVVVSDYVR